MSDEDSVPLQLQNYCQIISIFCIFGGDMRSPEQNFTRPPCWIWINRNIEYLDFASLYPFCMARKSYHVGHPEVIYKDFQPLENYYGFIKARVLPPRGPLHPVLPHRCREKLMFPLCGTFAETDDQTGQCCEHSDAERGSDVSRGGPYGLGPAQLGLCAQPTERLKAKGIFFLLFDREIIL